jgi:hypothetical protein
MPLSTEMTSKIEDYFEYYWQHDKNYACKTDLDMRFMEELPEAIRRSIYENFLF